MAQYEKLSATGGGGGTSGGGGASSTSAHAASGVSSNAPRHTKVRIKLKSFEQKLLDDSVARIKKTAENTGARIVGPILLPTKIRKFTILRSVHTDKKSREQFEERIHRRILDIVEPSPKTIDELMKIVLPPGVDIEIKD